MPPQNSEGPQTRDSPRDQETPGTPEMPGGQQAPGAPGSQEIPDRPDTEETPGEPAGNQTAAAPDSQETAAAQEIPATAESGKSPGTGNGPGTSGWERQSLRLSVTLGVAAILLGGFGGWAMVAAHSLRSAAAAQNVALTDRPGTNAVSREVTAAVNTIFSYSYADTARTRQAAQLLLTGPAIRQYDQLFSLVERDAPKEKLVVTTTVTDSGVEFLTGNSARVLIFANQQDTRAGTNQTTYAGAMFAVTAVRQDGRWKIENIDTFTGG